MNIIKDSMFKYNKVKYYNLKRFVWYERFLFYFLEQRLTMLLIILNLLKQKYHKNLLQKYYNF